MLEKEYEVVFAASFKTTVKINHEEHDDEDRIEAILDDAISDIDIPHEHDSEYLVDSFTVEATKEITDESV